MQYQVIVLRRDRSMPHVDEQHQGFKSRRVQTFPHPKVGTIDTSSRDEAEKVCERFPYPFMGIVCARLMMPDQRIISVPWDTLSDWLNEITAN